MCVLSHVRLFATPWPVDCQAPLSMEFSRQEHWNGSPFPPPGDLPDPGIEHGCSASPALAGGFLPHEPPAGGRKRERDREGGGKTFQKEKQDNAAQAGKDKRQDARRPRLSQGMAAGTRTRDPLVSWHCVDSTEFKPILEKSWEKPDGNEFLPPGTKGTFIHHTSVCALLLDTYINQ